MNDGVCGLCDEAEFIRHLFFKCDISSGIWQKFLSWLMFDHVPDEWETELNWIMIEGNRKKVHGRILECAIAEMVYVIWNARNRRIHGTEHVNPGLWRDICHIVAVRCARVPKLNLCMLSLVGRC